MSSLHIVCPDCHSTNRLPLERERTSARCGRCKAPLFTATPLALTAANFYTHLQKSDIPLLVDFWAPWCGPCQMMAPVFEQAAARLEPALRLIKVDTEAQQPLAIQFQIRSIPTLALFNGGAEVARQPGAMDLSTLLQWVERHLSPLSHKSSSKESN